jgi:hypothetical protein
MLDTPTIIANLVTRIGWVYERPLMYGGTPAAVEGVIECLHSMWAMCLEREQQYRIAMEDLHRQEEHHAMNCSTWYAEQHPRAPEEETAAYVVSFYKRLDVAIGLPATSNAPH